MSDDIAALIERIEKAEGPSRELDVEIVFALHPDIGAYQPHCAGDEPIFWHEPYRKMPCPKFTASLDAALTLVPEGHDLVLYADNGKAVAGCCPADVEGCTWANNEAASLPLALCAAALRARSVS